MSRSDGRIAWQSDIMLRMSHCSMSMDPDQDVERRAWNPGLQKKQESWNPRFRSALSRNFRWLSTSGTPRVANVWKNVELVLKVSALGESIRACLNEILGIWGLTLCQPDVSSCLNLKVLLLRFSSSVWRYLVSPRQKVWARHSCNNLPCFSILFPNQ